MSDPLNLNPILSPKEPDNASAWPQRIAVVIAFAAVIIIGFLGGWLDQTTQIVVIALAALIIIWGFITWLKKNPDMEKLLVSLFMIFMILAALVYFLILNKY